MYAELHDHCDECDPCAVRLRVAIMLNHRAVGSQRTLRRAGAIAAATFIGAMSLVAYQVSTSPNDLSLLATTEPPPVAVVRFQVGLVAPTASPSTVQPRLLRAGELLADRRYGEALEILRGLVIEEPSSEMIAAHLGMALYLSGDNSPEVGRLLALGAASSASSLETFSKWYLGNYLLRTGDVEAAREILTELSTRQVLPGRLAGELLAELTARGQ